MTQWQYETILKIISEGAPVLYNNVGKALDDLILERNKLVEDNKSLQEKVDNYEKARRSHKKVEDIETTKD